MPDGDNRATPTATHDVCPSCKGAGEHYDSHWRHGGTAAVCHPCGNSGLILRRVTPSMPSTPTPPTGEQ